MSLIKHLVLFCFISVGWTAAQAENSILRIACVGDSITYGYGLKDRDHDSWQARLSKIAGVGYDVRNFGVSATTMIRSGDFPYVTTPAWKDALAFTPDIVIIALGTNDSKHPGPGSLETDKAVNNWSHRADYPVDYTKTIAAFRDSNPAVVVYVCLLAPAFPGRWGINGQTIHDEINPLIRKIAKKNHAKVIDLYSPLIDQGAHFSDAVHPDAAGDLIIAQTVAKALKLKVPAGQ